MIALGLNDISLSFGVEKILDNITFHVEESDRVGVIGVNGAGKSTLFKIITGEYPPDEGEIYISKEFRVGYLKQNSGLDSSATLWDEMISAYSHLIEMEKRIQALEGKISTEKDESKLSSYMKEYSSLTDSFSRMGGFEYNSKVKGVLKGLGFQEDQFDRKIHSLSGGQKTRLSLAKLLLEEPDILLLDEPTNHLDLGALEWLEEFLKAYKKCVLLVSHDRYFLDIVTNKTLEIENTRCNLYTGNYSSFVQQKSVDREIQQKHYDLQQKEIKRMEAFIEQQRRWNREKNIVAAESRQKAIDRMEKVSRPDNLPGKIHIKLRSNITSGNDVLFVENLAKEYSGHLLFKNVSFQLKRNEKVFMLGPNGCGKSTLLKLLTGKVEKTSGYVEYGHKVQVGYFDQEQEGLNPNHTVIDDVWESSPQVTQTELRNALASFLFTGEDVFKSISVLSGGEKSRVSLVKLMLSGANFLILDEPTNHLDINSREVLEQSLSDFDGTILAVSHDRYFINKLSSRILEFDGTGIVDYNGNYSGYSEYKKQLKNHQEASAAKDTLTTAKLEHLESKQLKARQRKVEKLLQQTEEDIHRIEERLVDIDAEMLDETVCSDHVLLSQLHQEQNDLNLQLEKLYEQWEALSLEKEEFTEPL